MAFADGPETESRDHCHICYGVTVIISFLVSFNESNQLIVDPETDSVFYIVLLSRVSAGLYMRYVCFEAPTSTSPTLPLRSVCGRKSCPFSPASILLTRCSGAEITSIILCTCFPIMPRLGRLLSDRYSQSKSHLLERRGKGNLARNGEAKKIQGCTHNPGSYENTARLKRSYKQLVEVERVPEEQASQIHLDTTMDIELATWNRSDVGGKKATII